MQRFERPELTRLLKFSQTRGGQDTKPRGYQDERFSYVVLRRGARRGSAEGIPSLVIDQWRPEPDYGPLLPQDAPPEVIADAVGKAGARALGLAAAEEGSGEDADVSRSDLELDILIARVLSGEAPESLLLQEPPAGAGEEEDAEDLVVVSGQLVEGEDGSAPVQTAAGEPPRSRRRQKREAGPGVAEGQPPLGQEQEEQQDGDVEEEQGHGEHLSDGVVAVMDGQGRLHLRTRDWLDGRLGIGGPEDQESATAASPSWPRLVRPPL